MLWKISIEGSDEITRGRCCAFEIEKIFEDLADGSVGLSIDDGKAILAPPPETFRKARDIAAWLGLVPRQHSTGGKQRLGATTRMAERSLRRLLTIGARLQMDARYRPRSFMATPQRAAVPVQAKCERYNVTN